jgi:outer membrane protein
VEPRLVAFLRTLLVCVYFVAVPSAWAEEAGQSLAPVRLDQAVGSALDNNASIKNSQLEVEISRDRIMAAKTHFLPAVRFNAAGLQLLTPLNFDFGKGVFGTFESTGPIPAKRINVSTDLRPLLVINTALVQPILQLGRVQLGVRQLELSRLIAQQKLRAQRQQIVNQTRHAYYKALELEESIKVIDATRTLYREIQRLTAEYLSNKTVLPSDAIEVKQNLATTDLDYLRLKNGIELQKEELNRLLGRELHAELSLVSLGDVPSADMDLATAQSRALSSRAELKQLSFQSKQVDLERRIKQWQYLPDLNLIVDYLSVFGAEVLPKNIVFTGLVLNWEPIDWGRRRHEISEQSKLLKQANNSLRDVQAQISIEVSATYRRVQESKQSLVVTQLGRELALERLRVATDRYKEKAALLKEVLQGQRDLSQANNQYTQSVLALWTARADFEKAIGED